MIAESLAGKRIAITGATGFVGTALVERLLRVGARLRARAARPRRQAHARGPRGSSASCCRTTPSTGCAPSAAPTARRVVRGDDRAPDHDDRRRRQHRRARAVDADRATFAGATSSSTPPRPCRSTRRSTRRSRSTCSARRASPSCSTSSASRPHLVAVSTCYVAGNRRGTAPEELVSDGPFDLGLTGGPRSPPPAGCAATPRPPAASPTSSPSSAGGRRTELGAAGAPALAAKTEQLRERWVQDQLVEAGRARAASVGWPDAYAFTKALGEQALIDSKGDVPVSIVRPSIIESALGRAAPGLDPRLPHGRAGDHLLRPRPAERVPRRARGHGRRDPGRHRRRRDHRRRRARTGARRRRSPRSPPAASTRSSTACSSTTSAAGSLEHPLYDAEGQPIVVPEWDFPGRGRVQAQLTAGEEGDHDRREGAPGAAAARQAGRAVGPPGDQADRGRAGARVRRAVRPLHRVRGDLPGRQPAGDVGRPRRRRPARRSPSTRG